MSIQRTPNTTESTETEPRGPRNGLAQALLEADKDDIPGNASKVIEGVERWVCAGCGKQNLVRPTHCGDCGEETFDRVVPSSQEGESR